MGSDLDAKTSLSPSRMASLRWRLHPRLHRPAGSRTCVKRVAGVHAVANDIEVRLPAIDQRPDPDIAGMRLPPKSELPISHDKIKIIVKDGRITWRGGGVAISEDRRRERRAKGERRQGRDQRHHGQAQGPTTDISARSRKRSSATPRWMPIGSPSKLTAAR